MNADDGNTETIVRRSKRTFAEEQNRRVWSHESDRRVQREEPVR